MSPPRTRAQTDKWHKAVIDGQRKRREREKREKEYAARLRKLEEQVKLKSNILNDMNGIILAKQMSTAATTTSAAVPESPPPTPTPQPTPTPTPDTQEQQQQQQRQANRPATIAPHKRKQAPCYAQVLVEQPQLKSRRKVSFDVCSLSSTDKEWVPVEAGIICVGQLLAALMKVGFSFMQATRTVAAIINWPSASLKSVIQTIDSWPEKEMRLWLGPIQSLFTAEELEKPSQLIVSNLSNLRTICSKTEAHKITMSSYLMQQTKQQQQQQQQ